MVRRVLRMFLGGLVIIDPSQNPAAPTPVKTNEPQSTENNPQQSRFSEGQKIAGCYELKRRIAGSDEPGIWLAHDEVLGKDVSLHFVPSTLLSDAAALIGLRQEVKRTRQLIHPNILRVYDLVEDADWAAVSMDAFEGESLSARLAKLDGAGFDPEAIQPWIVQLCHTLDDAHKINVVHRDVAPENIFLSGDGKLLVTNFGISRFISDAVSRVAGNGVRAASVSPQQLDGATPSRQDDIYSIGTLLFQCLTGRLPFTGGDVSGQIRKAVPPSVSSVRGQGSAQIPEAWQNVIAACLEKKAEARPQSAAEIAQQLSSEQTGGASLAAPAAALKKKAGALESATVAAAKSVSETVKAGPKIEAKSESLTARVQPEAPTTLGERKFAREISANQTPVRSRFPAIGFALAAGLMVIGAVGYYFNGQGGGTQGTEPTGGLTATEPPEGSELRSINNKIEAPAPAEKPALLAPTPRVPELAPVANRVATPALAEPALLIAAAAPVEAPGAAPAPAPATTAPAAQISAEDKAVTEKAAALEKVKQAGVAAEKLREDLAKQQAQASAAVVEAQKALDQKTKTAGPAKKAADDVMTQRKKLEDEQKAAETAAEQARLLAAEKARLADAARKAMSELDGKSKEKLAAQEKADAEIQALQKMLLGTQQTAANASKAATDAEGARQQSLAAIKQSEQEVEQAKLAAAEARRLREEAEAERRKLGQELAEMQKMMERKKLEIEDRLRKLENPAFKPVIAVPIPELPKVPDPKPIEKPETPTPAIKPTSTSTPPLTKSATPTPVAVLPKPTTPMPATPAVAPGGPKPATPAPAAAITTQLAMKTDPDKLANAPAGPKSALRDASSENSLGMKFVPVGGVEFGIWQTRVKDFETFAKAVNLKSSAWKSPGFKQSPDHPVVNVTWVEAVAFCKWLTEIEHKDGTLPTGQFYRLPTDLEWSQAVGLPEETGKTAEARDMGVADVYPWGTNWPPPPNTGNYTGEETGSDVAIKGYDDGYAWTSPVGSFPPNNLGLYDMGGNVWQWCMDAWNNDSKAKVLRGASWYNGALKLSLLSSCRVHASPDSSTDNYGFRIVRVSESGKAGKK